MKSTFDQVYESLRDFGKVARPRGLLTREMLNFAYTLKPYERWTNYPSRKLSIDYIKKELLWYFKGDRADLSICDHAKIWRDCVTDGLIHSNYGYYLFREGRFAYAVDCLRKDKDSRRAVMTILGGEHLFHRNNDVPCTVSISLRIRDQELQCTVHMRSQDAIYGLGNDAPFFSIIQEMAFTEISPYYPFLQMGPLTVFVESFHVYERHFDLLDKIVREESAPVACPHIASPKEVSALLRGETAGAFSEWLYAT